MDMDADVLNKTSVSDLLKLYSRLMSELRNREIVRSSNNPVADYTEHLVRRALHLDTVGNSTAGYDARDPRTGKRYQIKGRRLTPENQSTELSAIRNLKQRPFDFLAGVVFAPDFTVEYAALVPFKVVREHAHYSQHTNAHRFLLRRDVLLHPGVTDITRQVSKASKTLA